MAKPSVVDIFLASLNQQPGKHGGPVGRVTAAKNAHVSHFIGATTTANGPAPARLSLETRDGVQSMTTDLRNILDGSSATGSFANPEVLATLDSQLTSICNSVPRVFNGNSWSLYPNSRVLSNVLSARVTHTSERLLHANSDAVMGDVTASVWTEITYNDASAPIGTAYIGFKQGDVWIRSPSVVRGPGSANESVLCKIVTDGTYFYTFVNAGFNSISVSAWDINGQQLASLNIADNSTSSPGDWDVTYLQGGTLTYYVSPNSVQYGGVGTGGPGTWLIPAGGFLPSAVGGTFTIAGDPAAGVNGTYTITAVTSPSVVSATPNATPTPTYDVPPAATAYLGGGAWDFTGSTLDIPVGSTVVVSASADPTLDGTFTVTSWDNVTKLARMTPSLAGGPIAVGASATIAVTYAASLPYTLDSGDTILATYTAPGRVVMIQPHDPVTPTDGVDFTVITFDGTTLDDAVYTDLSVKCAGPISWVTNDLGDSLGYFCTEGETEGHSIFGWQTAGAGQTHEYNTGQSVPSVLFLGSFIGFPKAGVNPNQPSLVFGVGYLADGSTSSAGPLYDPAFRNVSCYETDFSNTTTTLRVNNGSAAVTRAFQINGEYFYGSYYESGSGSVTNVAPISVSHTSGDFMTGPVSQPFTMQPADAVWGPDTTLVGNGVLMTTTSGGAQGITSADTVEPFVVTSGDLFNGAYNMPVGTGLLKWTFANFSLPATEPHGQGFGALKIVGNTDAPIANGFWQCVFRQTGHGTHTVYTYPLNAFGQTIADAVTFTSASGTAELPAYAQYSVQKLDSVLTTENGFLFIDTRGAITWSGDPVSANDGTFGIVYAGFDSTSDPSLGYWKWSHDAPYVIVAVVSQAYSLATTSAVIVPQFPNQWNFNSTDNYFDASSIGAFLELADGVAPSGTPGVDLGSFQITGTNSSTTLVTADADAAGVVPYIWEKAPFPIGQISQDLSQAYRIQLQTITFTYALIGALISVVGDTLVASNNGVYKVLSIDATDTGNHTVFVQAMNGKTDQRNQLLTGSETITIFPPTGIAPVFQPCWFLTPMTGIQPQVACFERGLADADWIQEGQIVDSVQVPNLYPRALTSVAFVSEGIQFTLPYRASNFTAGGLAVTPTGQVINAVTSNVESTVGLKRFLLANRKGVPVASYNELLIPGPLTSGFTESGFHEQGINIGLEAPFIVGEETDTSASVIGLQLNVKYIYQAVVTTTDDNGDVVLSPPSPTLSVTLTGTNNTVTIGGRTINPISADGTPSNSSFGLSNRKNLTIRIYRCAVINGVPSPNLYEITDPANPNGLYSGSGPGSGFTFLDDGGFTWYFRDQVADAIIVNHDVIYTGQGFLPSFPAPPASTGVTWAGRTWLCAYDGSLYMSMEKREGTSLGFFPDFRYIFPSAAVACAPLDTNLYVFCADTSIWTIPLAQFPDATGANGALPTPRLTPFTNSCTGYAQTVGTGVVYSSTAGDGSQLWIITRNQQNYWLSEPIQDGLFEAITGLTVDSKQRLYVTTGGQLWCYDPIPDFWASVDVPNSATRLTTFAGNLTYADGNGVHAQNPGTHADTINGTTTPIPLDITLADLNMAQVRAYVRAWAFQMVGEYRGPHWLNAILSYPDDMPGFDDTFRTQPDPSKPYLIEINPTNELCSTFGLRIFSSFEGVSSPGDSFTLELISAKVGLRTGQRDVPDGQRTPSG